MRQHEHSSKSRLRAAAKELFAEKGYEATTIADITRSAKTSHSQFLKYYSGKEELRTEIIEQQWSELTKAITLVTTSVQSPREQLKLALNMFVSFLEKDFAFRAILLLEQTASRNRQGFITNPEFQHFVTVLGEIVSAMKAEGELSTEISTAVLRSALIGAVEGMMRDRLLAAGNFPAYYSTDDVREVLSILADAACRVRRPTRERETVTLGEALSGRSTEDDWIRYYLKLGDTALNPSELS